MKQILAPAGAKVHGPGQPDNPDTVWWVDGIAYTADPAQLAYFETAGYTVIDAPDGTPPEHQAAVTSLRAQARHVVQPAVAMQDGLAPNARNYH
ncbi:hypothetical protein EDD99_7158 [Streptomyces sp. 846.5]|nr:hypothetical protein [Streptomyces sp. 846.5]TDT95333.1 hypothetical protein EDD99_7158 [Streptomyces sp. 846.5]